MTVNPIERIRVSAAEATAGLFAHDAYPLARSLDYPGDPGLFGPDSPTWTISGDVATFVGGIRALLIQAAHPEVVAGVDDHSVYHVDPLGRLSRTSSYVTATAFGAMPEVDEAIARVRKAHVPVHGTSHRGQRYSASGAPFAAWVHNVLTDSFLVTNQHFGRIELDRTDADTYVAEQSRVGSMLHARDLPSTADGLADWIASHPDIGSSPGMERTVGFLKNPPLPTAIAAGYRVLFQAAVTTIPERVRDVLGVSSVPGARVAGRAMVDTLRWTMGSSPSWWLALERTGAPFPSDVHFRRPPPANGVDARWDAFTSASHVGDDT